MQVGSPRSQSSRLPLLHNVQKRRKLQRKVDSYSVHFKFSQHFDLQPDEAYEWCTDYDSGDIKLQGRDGIRKTQWINEDTILLTDLNYVGARRVAKRKLVRLYPERLSWTNTRVSSEGKHSQFLYEISGEKGGSRLDFTGSQVFHGKKPSAARLQTIAGDLAKENSAIWRNLAKAMAGDLRR